MVLRMSKLYRPHCAALLLAIAAAAALPPPAASVAAGVKAFSISINAAGLPLLTPTNYTVEGRAVYYEIPVGTVLGTLAFFHGCAHDASDGWPRASCPECDGLPEEVAHTKQALARGYAVIAIDASDPTRCFAVHADQGPVAAILRAWLAQHNLQGKPLYAVGVSAGGAFALKLPMALRVHGVISEVLGVLPDSWEMQGLGAAFPPTAFVSMPRDTRTAARIAANMATLRAYGVPTDILLADSLPVTPDFLSNRSELITPEESAQVAGALQVIGLTDANGTVVVDPRAATLPWRVQLPAMVPELAAAQDSLQPDASAISEELNRAFAGHEIVGDYVTACLAWLEARGTLPLAGLAQQFADISLPGPRLRDLQPTRLHMLPMRPRKSQPTVGSWPLPPGAVLGTLVPPPPAGGAMMPPAAAADSWPLPMGVQA